MLFTKTALSLSLLGIAAAHFTLEYPTSAGFNDDNEGIAPCGGFPISYTSATDFHVDGDSIAMTSTHATAVWLIRATLDQTAFGNYTNILPTFQQNSLGHICTSNLKVNSTWAGKKGIIQIVQDATDGLLYQCAPVNFVSGAASSVPSVCVNSTGVTAVYTTAAALSSVPAATAAAATGAGTQSTTSASAMTTSSSRAAAEPTAYAAMQGVFWAAAGVMGAAVVGGL